MRIARAETNIAYRRADNERWSQMDFVIGQRVQLSKSHPKKDICDKLAGDYPKDFVFEGWHPQCFCFVTPILMDEDEFLAMEDARLAGKPYKPKVKPITEYPAKFKDWVRENKDKIAASRARGTEPYFVRNNLEVVEGLMKSENEDSSSNPPIMPPIITSSNSTDDNYKNKRIENNKKRYEQLVSDPDYFDVEFNPNNGGLKASHQEHNFDKVGGKYEKLVQNFGYLNGDSVILEKECHNIYKQKNTEGLWNGMRFEVAGAENGTSSNIRNALKYCAKKPNIEIAVIFFPNHNFEEVDIINGLNKYNGLKGNKNQWVKFKEIIFIDKLGKQKKYLP